MRQKFLAAMFPLAVLGLMAAERLVTWLLGSFPSSPALWAASLALRSMFRDSANWLEAGSGSSMTVQIGLLTALVALLLFAMRARRWTTLSFLVNHAALLLVARA